MVEGGVEEIGMSQHNCAHTLVHAHSLTQGCSVSTGFILIWRTTPPKPTRAVFIHSLTSPHVFAPYAPIWLSLSLLSCAYRNAIHSLLSPCGCRIVK